MTTVAAGEEARPAIGKKEARNLETPPRLGSPARSLSASSQFYCCRVGVPCWPSEVQLNQRGTSCGPLRQPKLLCWALGDAGAHGPCFGDG
jgi:hypothetical protein